MKHVVPAVVLALSGLGLLGASGCSTGSSSPTPAPASETTPTTPVTDAAPPETPDTGAPKPEKDSGAPEVNACAATTTQADCATCCTNAHEDGAAVYFTTLFDCMCAADTCQTACAKSFCNEEKPVDPDTACGACIQSKKSACAGPIQTACEADTDCKAFDACVQSASCLSKP